MGAAVALSRHQLEQALGHPGVEAVAELDTGRGGPPVKERLLGLLTSSARTAGRRQYDESVLRRLDVIAFAEDAGFTLAEIRSLLSGPGHATEGRHTLTMRKLEEVNARIARAQAMRELLEASLACDCDALEGCPAVRGAC